MKVQYTKEFTKAVQKQSGKIARSIRAVIEEVKAANSLSDISNLKKITGLEHVYRVRIGSLRAFFTFHIEIVGDTVIFRYLTNRGEAYSKEMMEKLKNVD